MIQARLGVMNAEVCFRSPVQQVYYLLAVHVCVTGLYIGLPVDSNALVTQWSASDYLLMAFGRDAIHT